MWPLLESTLSPAVSSRNKVACLNLISHVHKFRFEDAEIAIMKEKIQELISSPLTRLEGYLFLDALLTNNPTAYIHNWGPIIIGSLKCSDNYVSKRLTLRILTLVVVNFSANSSCAEPFQRFIPEILLILLEVEESDQDLVYFCRTLAICMQHMPAILGPHSDEIELFLMKHVNSLSHDVIEAISDCFAAFPVCLGNFQNSKRFFMDTWLDVHLKTLNTLQALFNDILVFLEVEDSYVGVDGLVLFKIPFDPDEESFSYVNTRITIFSNLCKCLAKMMSVRFEFNSENTRVQVPVQELLKCLERVLKVKEIVKVKKMPKCKAFLLAYPLLQNAVLVVVRALIVNFPILEQSGNFAKLLRESIDATTLTTLTLSSLRQVRSSTWKTLNVWLKQYGAKGSYEITNDRFLIHELLKDIALDSENGHSQANGTVELSVDTFREECCFEALQVVHNIFTTGGSFMDKRLVDEISTTILKTVRKIQLHMHPAKKFPYPYTNENCRLILYESLFSASLFAEPLQAKYINPAINIFKIALKDPYVEVILLCHRAFKLYRYIINPKKPPPEALSYLNVVRAPPPQENVLAGWENGNWNINNESSQEEKSMEVAPPCQIETVFHNSIKNDGQRDLLPVQNAKSPLHYSEAHESQSQCNGNNGRIASNKPSHSNICNDSGSEIEEYKEYNLEDTHLILPVDIPPIAPTPIIKSIDPQVCEPKPTNVEPKIIELRPLEPVTPEKIATTNHHDSSGADVSINCIDDVEVEEEIPPSHRRMAENGMDVESEDEESGDEDDEEGTGSDEDEEVNETYQPDDGYSPEFYHHDQEVGFSECSPEYYRERPIKRRKMSNEEEHSSEEYEEEKSSNQNQEMNQDEESEEEEEMEMPNRSPTVNEMCQDFVLAEPEEIS